MGLNKSPHLKPYPLTSWHWGRRRGQDPGTPLGRSGQADFLGMGQSSRSRAPIGLHQFPVTLSRLSSCAHPNHPPTGCFSRVPGQGHPQAGYLKKKKPTKTVTQNNKVHYYFNFNWNTRDIGAVLHFLEVVHRCVVMAYWCLLVLPMSNDFKICCSIVKMLNDKFSYWRLKGNPYSCVEKEIN